MGSARKMQLRFNDTLIEATTTDDVLAMVPAGEMLSMPLQAGLDLEQVGISAFATLTTAPGLLGGKVHGSLARAGKVKGQTPRSTPRRRRRTRLAVPSDACNTTVASSTSSPHSARRRAPTRTLNIC